MKVSLESNRYGHYTVTKESGEQPSLYYQNDYDFPGLARDLGWDMAEVQQRGTAADETCQHACTDGTVACPHCGLTATDFIAAAIRWLDDNDGNVFDVDADRFSFE